MIIILIPMILIILFLLFLLYLSHYTNFLRYFYDKMVYKLAYDEYMKAKKDFSVKEEAERHIAYLETQIPTKEDQFMHKNKKLSDSAAKCYNTWIQ